MTITVAEKVLVDLRLAIQHTSTSLSVFETVHISPHVINAVLT